MNERILLTILIVLFLVIAEVAAEYFIQSSVEKDEKGFHFMLSMLLYMLIPLVLYTLFKTTGNITVANTIWQVANIVLVALVGYFAFNDNLTPTQIVGLVLAMVAAFLMMFGESEKNKNKK